MGVIAILSPYNVAMVEDLCRGHFPLKKQRTVPFLREMCVMLPDSLC